MKYKMIAVDMDGTLLNDKKHISDYNIKMIDKAVKLGIKFVIASGRIPATLRLYEETVSKSQPMICCNGAVVLDDNKNVISSSVISKKSLLQVIDLIRKQDRDVYFHIYHGDIMCSEQFRYSTESFYKFSKNVDRKYRIEIRILKDAREYIEDGDYDINKLVIVDEDIKFLEDMRMQLDKIDEIEITKSEANNLEILSKHTSKGNALSILSSHYNIPLEQCIAVGNDENDVSMIKTAGLGVCMKNGRECARKYANYITEKDNNDGGIGEVIEKFMLNGD
ncbi:Cof-type HAD-IIB family hydrolase [Clostridium sp. JN-1]|uniref:Cof-type HAD-IIB family hydrolase n=1 Tax=Clostridium sp. JN-1 TaxID=2483110 RepID=UPI000F0B37C2|nr:Cof-type HAD-IIB family hydrolase [Clostridium sp. JN-1]